MKKIIVTVGPTSLEPSKIQAMEREGVEIFRINLSHMPLHAFVETAEKLMSWTRKTVCIDTEGAQLRTGKIKQPGLLLRANQRVELVSADVLGDEEKIPLYPVDPAGTFQVGDILAIDFHALNVQVTEVSGQRVWARVLTEGRIGDNKGVSVDRSIPLEAFTQKDKEIFKLSRDLGIKAIAFSFAARSADVEWLRGYFGYPVTIISKIESREGLRNLEEIARSSNAILIDRGDLSKEIPVQKIGIAQRQIVKVAKSIGTPVYIATNLLETMITGLQPSRAEINDITSTLLSGADGLVLAAETAIGKYPVEAVRMIAGTIKETEHYEARERDKNEMLAFLSASHEQGLIDPHGGELVQNFLESGDSAPMRDLPSIHLDERAILDFMQISQGVYSPVSGFMGADEMNSILSNHRLLNGEVWTLPILLQIHEGEVLNRVKSLKRGETLLVTGTEPAKPHGTLELSAVERIDLGAVARAWFGTDDEKHPGVALLFSRGPWIISGEVRAFSDLSSAQAAYSLTPKQARKVFQQLSWRKVIGFHTRNVIHRGHEYIQKVALAQLKADGLYISPAIGPKKPGDFTLEAIVGSYQLMTQRNYYAPYSAILSCFNTYPRYSGPREAIFTALCRKNFGCTHFIVGRDHAGVGSYFPSDASQRIFEKMGDIGIEPVFFDVAYYCAACSEVTTGCSHQNSHRADLSGSSIRGFLESGKKLPEEYVRPDISAFLEKMVTDGKPVFEY